MATLLQIGGLINLEERSGSFLPELPYTNRGVIRQKEVLSALIDWCQITIKEVPLNKAYEVELSPCSINGILLNVLFSFYKDIKIRGMKPLINIPEQDIFIQGNESALRRIFQNILKNCIEHGKENLSVRLISNIDMVQIDFENDFPAEEPIEIARVFDRFYKADSARSKTSTGLGLSIAKELVNRLNGSVTVDVKNNHFVITMLFPLRKE